MCSHINMQIHTGSHLSLPYLWPFDLRISACQGPAVNCWLGNRKGILPVKTEWWGAGTVFCLEQGADLHMFQLMSLPLPVSCFSKIQISFTFLVPAHPGNRNRAVKHVCVISNVFARNTQIILLIWGVLHLWGQKCKANWAHETIDLFSL